MQNREYATACICGAGCRRTRRTQHRPPADAGLFVVRRSFHHGFRHRPLHKSPSGYITYFQSALRHGRNVRPIRGDNDHRHEFRLHPDTDSHPAQAIRLVSAAAIPGSRPVRTDNRRGRAADGKTALRHLPGAVYNLRRRHHFYCLRRQRGNKRRPDNNFRRRHRAGHMPGRPSEIRQYKSRAGLFTGVHFHTAVLRLPGRTGRRPRRNCCGGHFRGTHHQEDQRCHGKSQLRPPGR